MTDLSQATIRELVDELKKRFAEMDALRAEAQALLGPTVSNSSIPEWRRPAKRGFLKMSAVKAQYWKDWHAYKAAHPEASVKEWQASKKAGKDMSIVDLNPSRRMKDLDEPVKDVEQVKTARSKHVSTR